MTLTGIVLGLIGSAYGQEPSEILLATYTQQVAAEDPKRTYWDKPASVGASAKIVGEDPHQDVIGQPKRTYITFQDVISNPQQVQLTFYTTSGSSWSSKDNKICGRPLTVEVHALYDEKIADKFRLSMLTWQNAPWSGTLVGTVEVNEPCTTSVDHPHRYTIDVTSAFADEYQPTAFMLKADARGELDPKALPTAQARWDAQTDVYIGVPAQGLPPTLIVTK